MTHVERWSLLIITEVGPKQKEYSVSNFIFSNMYPLRVIFNRVSRVIWDCIAFAFFAL